MIQILEDLLDPARKAFFGLLQQRVNDVFEVHPDWVCYKSWEDACMFYTENEQGLQPVGFMVMMNDKALKPISELYNEYDYLDNSKVETTIFRPKETPR